MKIERNNIYLGDCYELIKDIPDKSIDLIITDPPYLIENMYGGGVMKERNDTGYAKEIVEENLDGGIDFKILDEWCRVMKKINIYIWCNKGQVIDYLNYFVKEKNTNFEIILWHKDNVPPFCGTHYLVDKEYCLYFWEQGAPVSIPYNRGKTIYKTKTNVLDKKLYNHPTIKDLNIITNLILNSSKEGDIVLDTFLGSGTTCVSAKRNNRKYIGFEINEKFYKIAKDRLDGFDQNGQGNLFDL